MKSQKRTARWYVLIGAAVALCTAVNAHADGRAAQARANGHHQSDVPAEAAEIIAGLFGAAQPEQQLDL